MTEDEDAMKMKAILKHRMRQIERPFYKICGLNSINYSDLKV